MKRLIIPSFVSAIALFGLAFFAYLAEPAAAEVDGNCTAVFNGTDVATLDVDPDDAIVVQEDDTVVLDFQSPAGFESHKIEVSFVDFGSAVEAETDDDDGGDIEWSGTVNVSDWSDYGAGFYKVEGKAELSDGTSCSGAVLIEVDKNPLTTLAGLIAVAVTGVGGISLLGVMLASVFEGIGASKKVSQIVDAADYTVWRDAVTDAGDYTVWRDLQVAMKPVLNWIPFLLLPISLMTGMTVAAGESSSGSASGPLVPRASWRPRFSFAGVTGGLLAGLGTIALLQQYAVVFPELWMLIAALGIGVLLGIVPPSLTRLFAVMSVNRTLAKAEARLKGGGSGTTAAPSAPPPPPEVTPPPEERS